MTQDGRRGGGGALALLPAARLPALPELVPAASGWVAGNLAVEAEQRRLFPWLAVAFGAGILIFFGLTDGEPALWAPLLAAGVCAGLVPVLATRPAGRAVALGLAAAALGFAAGTVRVAQVKEPILARTTIGPLTGFVETLEERETGGRLIIRVASFAGLGPEARPERVRVSFRKAQSLRPGDFVALKARLLPPPEAARPGGYDFARDAYFRGIGAVGSVLGNVEVKPPPEAVPLGLRLAASVDEARNVLTRRIAEAGGGQAGAVAAALVTGKRGLIAQPTNDVLRAAGIYHVVSISGLHMVLAAGVVFWLVRAAFALAPPLALRWPIKKIAALVAMVGVTAYCVFSGWDIAAERSLLMTLIMLGAILVDRPAISMRNLALAALVALAREPEGLLGPSFQMSFGAVAGLIACARLIEGRLPAREGRGALARGFRFAVTAVAGTLATTLVAQLATAPFATYHFQTVQPFGLIGNALTLPLVSLAVMPAAVLGVLAYPFALDRPIWWLMGQAVQGMLAISGWIAGFAQANLVMPAFGQGALLLLAAALVLATIPATSLRWLAAVPATIGLLLATNPVRHDLYVDRDGAGAAIRGADGRLVALGRPPAFVLEQWLRADGDGRSAAQAGEGAACDRLGCNARAQDGRVVALIKDKRAFPEDCARADILITARTAPLTCAAGLIIDRARLQASGALAIRLRDGGAEISPSRDADRARPWRPRSDSKSATSPPVSPPRTVEAPAEPEPREQSDGLADAPVEPLQ